MIPPAFAAALDRASPLHGTLRDLAQRLLRRERRSHTLQSTALLHEALLRLRQLSPGDYTRGAIVDLFGQSMRRVLVDHARRRHLRLRADQDAAQRARTVAPSSRDDIAVLLDELFATRPRQAKVVELRFFAGLTVPEIARHLAITERTVVRDWSSARAWLRHRLGEGVS